MGTAVDRSRFGACRDMEAGSVRVGLHLCPCLLQRGNLVGGQAMKLVRGLSHWVSAVVFLSPQMVNADALMASASSGQWEARILTTASASKLQLWQLLPAESTGWRLILENSLFLPLALEKNSGEFRLADLSIAGDRLKISIQDRPTTTRAYMQRDFHFDLSKPQFPLSFFRTVTYREKTAGWLEVDFQTAKAQQCNEAPSTNLNQCEPQAVKLQAQFAVPSLTDMGDAFSYSAPLVLRLAY